MKEHQQITRDDIMGLLSRNSSTGVLSVYVGLPATERHDPGRWVSAVRSGFKDLLHGNPGDKRLPTLVEKAQAEIEALPTEARRRSLVYFRSLDPDWVFWKSLHPFLPDLFVFAGTPQVARLVSLLDESPVVGIAVISQDRVRVLTWREGIVEESELIQNGEELGSPPEGQPKPIPPNRAEDRVRRGLTRMAHRLGRVADGLHWQKLLLIGPTTPLAAIAEALPDSWKREIIDRVELNIINAPVGEIGTIAGKCIHDWRRRDEFSEISQVVEDARSGGRACSGVEACLDHLHKRGVERLFVCSDLELQGFSDADGRLHLRAPSISDGDRLQPELRLVERMVARALESGAVVVPVEGESAKRLGLLGGVAARLRWRSAPNRME